MNARARRKAHEQAAVLKGVDQVFRREDRDLALGNLGEAGGDDRGQAGRLQVEQDVVLASAGLERQLLERVQASIRGQERDQVPRRPDRQLAEREALLWPLGERGFPGQVDERDRRIAEQPGEG